MAPPASRVLPGALLALAACGRYGAGGIDVEVTVSPVVPTVATVTWTTPEPWAGRVSYASDDGPETEVISDAGRATAHEVVLYGLRPDTAYAFRVAVLDGDLEVDAAEGAFETGPAPAGLPDVQVSGTAPAPWFFTALVDEVATLVLLDDEGRVLWWAEDTRDAALVSHVYRSRDARGVLYGASSSFEDVEAGDDLQELVRIPLDGGPSRSVWVRSYHHDFVEIPGGTLACLAFDWRDREDERGLWADRLVEVSPDGEEREVWTAWDWFEYDPAWLTEHGVDGPFWTHANAVDYDPVEETYLVSLRNQDTIVKVDRPSGDLIWRFGGPDSDFTLVGGGAFPVQQHQFQAIEGGLLVFDNGPPSEARSRAVQYALDEEAGTATQVAEWVLDPPVFSAALGDVHRFPDGGTLVAWSGAGRMDAWDPAGAPAWTLSAGLGTTLGYVQVLDDLHGPLDAGGE